MNDDRVRELLSDYVEGNLADDEAAEVRAAIERSPELSAEARALRETMTALSGLHELPMPDLASKVEKTIHRRSKGRFFGDAPWSERLPLEWISLAVLLLLVATVFFFMLRGKEPVRIRPGEHLPAGSGAPKGKQPPPPPPPRYKG